MAATLSDFRQRYPAFASVSDVDVLLWLDEGTSETLTWDATTSDRAAMLYAAHKLAEKGMGAGAIPTGVTSFKSGTFSATVSDSLASATGYDATVYGREFAMLRRRNFAGPRMAWTPPAC